MMQLAGGQSSMSYLGAMWLAQLKLLRHCSRRGQHSVSWKQLV